MFLCVFCVLCVEKFVHAGDSLENGLALTPPMGWNTWNCFHGDIDEQKVREVADALVSSGMKDAGYAYVCLDDGWASSRDANGNIVADAQRFPSGIKALADYVHSKGLKFGIYTSMTRLTGMQLPGSLGYEAQDAQQYAAWGVDYLKYDLTWYAGEDVPGQCQIMARALLATQRPIVFSIATGWWPTPWLFSANIGNLWRVALDIAPTFES
ncbi:MAG: glycoside hydrolase family 27 protein, partial [Planctomycetota bacterium]